jgi:hypothetical protein
VSENLMSLKELLGFWIFFSPSGVLGRRNTTFRKPDLFPKRRVSPPKNTGQLEKSKAPVDSVWYTPSSEPFTIYIHVYYLFTYLRLNEELHNL